MASDINVAINSGGYVIVPESAVDGTGRDAIYVYMTYNGQTGAQSWKISGGLNGGLLEDVSVFLNAAQAYANNINEFGAISDLANDIADVLKSKLFTSLGNVLSFFGIFINFAELMEDCPTYLALDLAATIGAISYLLNSFVVFVAGGLLIAPILAIGLAISLTLVFNEMITDLISLAKDYCKAVAINIRRHFYEMV